MYTAQLELLTVLVVITEVVGAIYSASFIGLIEGVQTAGHR